MEFIGTREQIDIIEATEGFQRCAAVPGSGKTRVLTNRIAYLIKELYIAPDSIFALTFTNKAASEMKRRVRKMIGDEANCFIGTFHGLCNKILKEECYTLNWPKTFVILDQKDQINLIREIAEELQLSLTNIKARDYLDQILKEKTLHEDYVELIIGSDKEKLQTLLQETDQTFEMVMYHYFLKQRDNFLMDFTDMVRFTLYIFDNRPDIKEKWQDKCQYALCDEFQDVSKGQLELLNAISGKYKNLFVVGDDDQLIYGWREAKPEYMLEFIEDHEGAKDYYLSENFRSTPEIIAVANSLISHNVNRIEKQMYTNNPSGPKPVYNNVKTEKEEATWIVKEIVQAVKAGKKYVNHAVLVRAASQTRALEEAFVTMGIPYRIYSGAMFYSTEEIKTTLSYLRMVYSLTDLDFEQTINRPSRKFGKKSLKQLKEYAKEKNLRLIEALGEQIQLGMMKKKALIDYYNSIMELHENYGAFRSVELVNKVLDFGYRKALQEDVDQTRLDNVTELIATITALEKENEEPIPLEDLLAHFSLFSNQDEDTDEKDVVKIMTIHTAKGLEFDSVFVCGLVENLFPSARLINQEEMEEERRLFYVAITRAKTMLYLSGYMMKGDFFPCVPSRFMENINPDLLKIINGFGKMKAPSTTNMLQGSDFKKGDRVRHKAFGEGEIVGVNERDRVYEIRFDSLEIPRKIQFRSQLDKLE